MADLKMVVDNRERNISIIEELSVKGVNLTFAQLDVGDYIISDRICIERKTVSDFESSIINNRLFDQAERLHRSYEKPMLILEGDESEARLGNNVLIGAMLRLYTDFNIQIIRSRSAEETADILSHFATMEQEGEKRDLRIVGLKRAYSNAEWQMLVLSTIPGIGPKLALNLISHFKTIKSIASASEEELAKVDKIGAKKAKRIYEVLNGEFEGYVGKG
ncbi:MAG: hypothetical protein KGH72_04225 [Candidatus Micrarchaeota archaeon]|nr:hypothetical protein [Candidatus Micrarchaeota archaeon]